MWGSLRLAPITFMIEVHCVGKRYPGTLTQIVKVPGYLLPAQCTSIMNVIGASLSEPHTHETAMNLHYMYT